MVEAELSHILVVFLKVAMPHGAAHQILESLGLVLALQQAAEVGHRRLVVCLVGKVVTLGVLEVLMALDLFRLIVV